MLRMRGHALAALSAGLLLMTLPAIAAEPPTDPARQTPWGLYLTAREAFDMKQGGGSAVLFVDVRDPVEIMFTGFSGTVDVNVPFLLSNPGKWNTEKSVFQMERNPEFAAGIEAALAERGLDKSAPVILMCRSGGERSAPSAKALDGLGFTRVYVVVDGFEGGILKNHPNGPWRLKDGWKNSGLPWGYELDRSKLYQRDR